MAGSPKSGAMSGSTAMPTRSWRPPDLFEKPDLSEKPGLFEKSEKPVRFVGFHFPKINHERVKSAPQMRPYGTELRPARECRCRIVLVINPSTSTTIPRLMAARPLDGPQPPPRCSTRTAIPL